MSSACDTLNLGEQELDALHECVMRIVRLGAEVAVVRARNGEIVAQAERDPYAWPITYENIISKRLSRVDLGLATRRPIDLVALAVVARRIDSIVERAYESRWDWSPGRCTTRTDGASSRDRVRPAGGRAA